MEEMSIERVPPPPPPGFGDEEYYRLYGRPEEYHKYRQKLAQSLRSSNPSRETSSGSHSRVEPPAVDRVPPFVPSAATRSPRRSVKGPPFNSYEEEYEHFYGRKNRQAPAKAPSDNDSSEIEDDQGTPELSSSSHSEEVISVEDLSGSEGELLDNEEKDGQESECEKRLARVLPDSADEGTPSLSDEEGPGGRNRSPIRTNRSIKDRLGKRTLTTNPMNSSSSSSNKVRRRKRKSSSPKILAVSSSSIKRRRPTIRPSSPHRSRRPLSPPKQRHNGAHSRHRPPRNEHPNSHRNGARSIRRHSPGPPTHKKKPSSGRREDVSRRRRHRSPPLRGMESETHRRANRLLTRSPEERKTRRLSSKTRPEKPSSKAWQHDKFREYSGSPIEDPSREDNNTERKSLEGSHWRQIRSERSKERVRNGSRRSRSVSRSRRQKKSSRRRRGRRNHSSSRSSCSRYSSRSYSSDSSSHDSSSSYSSRSSSSSRRSSGSSLDSYLRSRRKPLRKRSKRSPPTNQSQGKSSVISIHEEDKVQLVDETEQPCFLAPTGGEGVVSNGSKYSEPPDFRRPRTKWRLYVFKGNKELPILYIHRQSSYLLGRDRKVADVPLDHPSCSKQHAVLQYRLVTYTRPDGSRGKRVRPYVVDLSSANGTFVNNKKIASHRFIQVLEKDVLKFGFSSREYVLLHDQNNDVEVEDTGLDS